MVLSITSLDGGQFTFAHAEPSPLDLLPGVRQVLTDPCLMSATIWPKRAVRRYQAEPLTAIARMVDGKTPQREMAAVFSRQAGKDELLAQLLAYLLIRHQKVGGSIVVVLPTLRPQAIISRDRLLTRLRSQRASDLTGLVRVRDGITVHVGAAQCHFLSAAPSSNVRGHTASLLLVANETQDIAPDRWDAVFAPMAAATGAPRLYLGTVWTDDTLLARQMRHLERLEDQDQQQRVFLVPWREVAAEVPAYGRYVEEQIAQLGADHPFIQTEYELRALDEGAGLFPESRLAQLEGTHAPLGRKPRSHGLPADASPYALLLDVAGEDEDETGKPGQSWNPTSKRDSTALTVVRVVPRPAGLPRYEIVRRYQWTGIKHSRLHPQLVDLAKHVWQAKRVVVDATGVGAGLASFLAASLGEKVVTPFVFSSQSKSRLGWDLLGAIDSGRLKDHRPEPSDKEAEALRALFTQQARLCQHEVLPGPNRLLRWSVPASRGHDDLLLSAALCTVLDDDDWRPRVAKGSTKEVTYEL